MSIVTNSCNIILRVNQIMSLPLINLYTQFRGILNIFTSVAHKRGCLQLSLFVNLLGMLYCE